MIISANKFEMNFEINGAGRFDIKTCDTFDRFSLKEHGTFLYSKQQIT